MFSKIGEDLGIDPNFVGALALQESGWNLAHVFETNPSSGGKPLNNLFGLTNAGGDNLAFSSVQASGDRWEEIWGQFLSNQPQTIQGSVNDLTSTPGHMYNTNPDWEKDIAGGKLTIRRQNCDLETSITRQLIAQISLFGMGLDLLGCIYLAYDLLGGKNGPLRTLTRAVGYIALFFIGYLVVLGIRYAAVAAPGMEFCSRLNIASLAIIGVFSPVIEWRIENLPERNA